MKKRIIALLAIIAVFGLALFAYAQTTSVNSERSCCTKDSCPMKKKDAPGNEAASSCDCCKDKCTGDSCPMKKKADKAQTSRVSFSSDNVAATSDGCCCSCCGDSCPMKKKDGEAKATTVSTTEGNDCCCCKGKKGTAV